MMQPWEESAAFVVSFISMVLVATGYFCPKKSLYLFCQIMALVGIMLSYFFTKEFFAMIGILIGIVRSLTFYGYEKKDKEAPLSLSVLFSALSVLAYFIVNIGILKDGKPMDLLILGALTIYAFMFRIRNMATVRFVAIVPAGLSIAYNLLANSTLFIVLTYVFELCASVLSIVKFYILPKYKEKNK